MRQLIHSVILANFITMVVKSEKCIEKKKKKFNCNSNLAKLGNSENPISAFDLDAEMVKYP